MIEHDDADRPRRTLQRGLPSRWYYPLVPMPSFLSGMRADVDPGPPYSRQTVFFEPGTFANAGGSQVWSSPNAIFVDPTGTGLGGRDRPQAFGNGQGMFFYAVADENGDVAGICSPAYDYGGPDYGGVVVPAGCTMLRKLPFMMCWRDEWGGVAPFHYSGAQNPAIDFTLSTTQSSAYMVPALTGPKNVVQHATLAPFVPAAGGARLVRLRYQIVPHGVAGTAYLGSMANALVELGPANPAFGGPTSGEIEMRVQGDGTFYWMINNDGMALYLFVRGYTVTEVTT